MKYRCAVCFTDSVWMHALCGEQLGIDLISYELGKLKITLLPSPE